MNKKIKIILVCLFVVLAAMTLAGCNLFPKNSLDPNTIGVTNINLVESEIRLCPPDSNIPSYRPDYSRYDLQISIWPENATNKNVTIALENTADSEYLGITAEGKLTSKKSKGKLNTEGNFVGEPIYVVITSVSNPTVSKRVTVYVEAVAITGFKFVPPTKTFTIGDAPWRLIPEFIPRHAVIGIENLSFSSTNEEFATVDADGLISPSESNVGQTTIEVTTTAGGVDIQGNFDVSVKYEEPKWTLGIDHGGVLDGQSLYTQVVGHLEEIPFFITTTQTRADNHPAIEWRVDNQRKPGEEGQTFNYMPDDIMRGTHKVSVRITDANGQVQVIESPNIEIYEYLTPANVTLTANYALPAYARDKVYVSADIEEDYYPPESIDWYLYNTVTGELEPCLGTSAAGNNYEFSFNIPKAGSFQLQANCSVKLSSTEISIVQKRMTEIIEVEEAAEGNNIQNVYLEGINTGTPGSPSYLPFVTWDAPTVRDEITVEVDREGVITRMSSADPSYSGFFYFNGFAIPQGVASLSQTFSVRVKGATYGYTESVTYTGGSIAPAQYKHLNLIDSYLNLNTYIPNLKKLGKIINYLHMFRPAAFAVPPGGGETRTGYKVNLYSPLSYDELDNDLYQAGLPSDYGTKSYTAEQINVFRLISAANNAYGESGRYSFNYLVKADGSFDATFYFNDQGDIVNRTAQSREEVPALPHYTSTPRAESYDDFFTEIPAQDISVTTSNQLYLAASWGLRPVPVAGSPAAEVYEAAKSVLRRIIDNSMSEAEKVHAIYDYLSCEVLYDNELLDLSMLPEAERPADFYNYDGFYMEGVFLNGSAVCDGIAKSFLLLAYMEGISAVKVSGSSEGVGHAWNYALVDGKWYGVDATWASVGYNGNKELSTHRHLLVTDAALLVNHSPLGEYPPTEEQGLGYEQYYQKTVPNTPDFDHYINDASEFETLYQYYEELVAEDTELTELYVEIDFDFPVDQGAVHDFFTTVNVGETFNWILLGNLKVVYVIVK
ncbi:MAG: transglutaminase domain-containing protein [Christensenellales bacterium]|jgi:hypothetical protein